MPSANVTVIAWYYLWFIHTNCHIRHNETRRLLRLAHLATVWIEGNHVEPCACRVDVRQYLCVYTVIQSSS